MINKLSSTALAIVMAVSCFADDVPTLKINQSNGESTVALSELLSIKYTDSDMVVNMKDGTKQVFALDDIIVMELAQMPTVINSIFSDNGKDAVYTITDVNGKTIAKGRLDSSLPKGIYIISAGGKSKKLLVK